MVTYDRIKTLCKQKGVTVTGTEKELGFARGSLCKVETNKPSMEKVQKLAEFFEVSVEYLTTGEEKENKEYYLNPETAELAQTLFENKDLRVLFDAAKDATPEDLQTTYNMLMALKKKERGIID
jgi:transcriptional regulator with XRE-family HTH domain